MEKINDLTLISDILPTGFHGCVSAGVKPGSHVYISGAGPVGRCAAAGARLLGAACVIVGDQNPERLKLLSDAGFETVDLRNKAPLRDQIEQILGTPEVDCGVDAVGFEAHGLGEDAGTEMPQGALNSLFDVVRAGGAIGVPGIYVGSDPDPVDADAADGRLHLDWGKMWTKSIRLMTGMAPVTNYNRQLTEAILWDRMPYLSKVMNIEVITLDQAPDGYAKFDKGSPSKFVIDPNGMLKAS
jgi:glutathione-independent formaldehyde dehydrogenase